MQISIIPQNRNMSIALVALSFLILLSIAGACRANSPMPRRQNILQKSVLMELHKPPWIDVPEVREGSVTGSLRVLVILVHFRDNRADTAAHTLDNYEELLFSVESFPTGSLRDYFHEVSNGKLDIVGDVTEWIMMPMSYEYYVNQYGFYRTKELARNAVALVDPFIDFTRYDNDGPDGEPNSGDDDGIVDAVFIIHAGPGAEETLRGSDIWSHKSSLIDWQGIGYMTDDGIEVGPYTVDPEEHYFDFGTPKNIISIGVFAHELGHILGLPDLYDVSGTSYGIGLFGLMGHGSWGGDGRSPQKPAHPCAWSKIKLGWIVPEVLEYATESSEIPQVESDSLVYKLWSDGLPEKEYFLVENRQKYGFDEKLPGSGLLIWHIDETVIESKPTRVNSNFAHKGVDLEEADGLSQLDYRVSYGDDFDYFYAQYNAAFTDSSSPNSKDNAGFPTNVTVDNISASSEIMYAGFSVSAAAQFDLAYSQHIVIDDSTGDGDRQADPGERILLVTELRSGDEGVYGLTGELSTVDEYITITQKTAFFGDAIADSTIDNVSDPFVCEIAVDCPRNHRALLTLTLRDTTDRSLSLSFELSVPISYARGWPQILAGGWAHEVIADLDGDGYKEMVVEETGLPENQPHQLCVYTYDGTIAQGWPVANTGYPAVADLDGDNDMEIITSGRYKNKVYVFHHDGSVEAGWPVVLDDADWISYPIIEDIDGDGSPEIIVHDMERNVVTVLNNKGEIKNGWPFENRPSRMSLMAVGDLQGDGSKEIVFGIHDTGYIAVGSDGTILPGWPVLKQKWCLPPVVGDLNGDGQSEVIAIIDQKLYALTAYGRTLPGWPISSDFGIFMYPGLADVDEDGLPEVVVAELSEIYNKLHVYNANGTEASGWPRQAGAEINEPLIGDIDGDGRVEILTQDWYNQINGWNHDGSKLLGFPLRFKERVWSEWWSLCDIDSDGATEIIAIHHGAFEGSAKAHVWEISDTGHYLEPEWGSYRHDVRHTAAYPVSPPIGPRISLLDYIVDDAMGNGNGKIDPGECIGLTVTIINTGLPAAEVSVLLHPMTATVTCSKDSCYYGNMERGERKSNTQQPFIVTIGSTAFLGEEISFELEIVIRGVPHRSCTFSIQIDGFGWRFPTGRSITSSPTIADIDKDGTSEVVVASNDGYVYAIQAQGDLLSNWPTAPQYLHAHYSDYTQFTYSSPAVGDVNDDDFFEVLTCYNSELFVSAFFVWNRFGVLMLGWPKDLGHSITISSPALCDLDKNGSLEILYGRLNGNLCAWHFDGRGVEGWPQYAGYANESCAAVGDLDNDGEVEVVAGSSDGVVWAWCADGDTLAGWPFTISGNITAAAALGDLDRDGDLEVVVVGYDDQVHVWHHNAVYMNGWPRRISSYSGASPALADIDSDGDLEILVCSGDSALYCWQHNGSSLEHWPVILHNETLVSSPVVGDVNGDGRVEVICAAITETAEGRLHALTAEGAELHNRLGFPLFVGATGGGLSTPALADLDNDDDIEICICSKRGDVFLWDLPIKSKNVKIEWAMLYHDRHHTSCYGYIPSDITGIPRHREQQKVPAQFALLPNFPNPFNPSTTIPFQLPAVATVTMSIYNVLGRKIRDLALEKVFPAGTHTVEWDGYDEKRNMASGGIYFCRMEARMYASSKEAFVQTSKLLFLR